MHESMVYYLIKSLVLVGYLIFFTYEDIKEKKISNKALLFMLITGIVLVCVTLKKDVIISAVVCAAICGVLSYLASVASHWGVGIGDVFLLAITGLYIGDFSMAFVVFASLVVMFLFTMVALIFRKITVKSQLPYVPFLLAGVIIGSII